MTRQKHLKRLVRARMAKTGEKYAAARRMVLRTAPPTGDPAARWHSPGSVAATTALCVLLAHAGVRDPRTGEPFAEPMLFGLAGGIGIGVFSFVYEKENWQLGWEVVRFHAALRLLTLTKCRPPVCYQVDRCALGDN